MRNDSQITKLVQQLQEAVSQEDGILFVGVALPDPDGSGVSIRGAGFGKPALLKQLLKSFTNTVLADEVKNSVCLECVAEAAAAGRQ